MKKTLVQSNYLKGKGGPNKTFRLCTFHQVRSEGLYPIGLKHAMPMAIN